MPRIAAPPAGPPGKAGAAPILLPERQPLAGPGKELPDAVGGLEGRGEDRQSQAEDDEDAGAPGDAPPPPLAWFAAHPIIVPDPAKPQTDDAAALPAAVVESPAVPKASSLPEPAYADGNDVGEATDARPRETGAGRKTAAPSAVRLPEAQTPATDPLDTAPTAVPAAPAAAPIRGMHAEAPVQRKQGVEGPVPASAAAVIPDTVPPAPGAVVTTTPTAAVPPLAAIAPAPMLEPKASSVTVAAAPLPPATSPIPLFGPAIPSVQASAAPAEDVLPVAPAAPLAATPAAPATAAPPFGPSAQTPHELRQAAAEAPVVRIALDLPAAPRVVSIVDVAPAQRAAAVAAAAQVAAPQLAAAFELPQPARPAAHTDAQAPDLSTLAVPPSGVQTAAAVTATAQGQQPALDTRRQEWTAKMIDTIEALRDAAPLRETKLSLMPEALGKVDVSIRQDDAGGIHVQFNTESQAARQIIADAQPKLAEIAEQRGIRLGSTQVETNAGGGSNAGNGAANPQMQQGQRHDGAPNRNPPSAPPSARREASPSTNSDERIA